MTDDSSSIPRQALRRDRVGDDDLAIRAHVARLNAPELFDGHLLVPERDGPESGCVPISEAVARWPESSAAAIEDFKRVIERVARTLGNLGDDADFVFFRIALTLPRFDERGAYLYSPDRRKLLVADWGTKEGALSSSLTYDRWAELFDAVERTTPRRKRGRVESNGRWWSAPMLLLLAIVGGLIATLVLATQPASSIRVARQLSTGARALVVSEAGVDPFEDATASGTAASDLAELADAGDPSDANSDADEDSDAPANDDASDGASSVVGDDSRDDVSESVVTIGPFLLDGGDARLGPHRRHDEAGAIAWRFVAGQERVTRTETRTLRIERQHAKKRVIFDVWIAPGRNFQGLAVEWQDAAGAWHAH